MASLTLDTSRVDLQIGSAIPGTLTAASNTLLEGEQAFVASQLLPARQSTVLRGTITALDSSIGTPGEKEVVCKYRIGDTSGLEREASFYQHNLRGLLCVPRFYGLYKGIRCNEAGHQENVACIVLEYFPPDRCTSIWKRPLQTRADVAAALLAIHGADVKHGEINMDNVLISAENEVCIVDFDRAEEHTCKAKPDVDVWDYEISRYHFGCDEIYTLMTDLQLWTPTTIYLQGQYFHVFDYIDPEKMAAKYVRGTRFENDAAYKEEVRGEAQEAIDACYRKYEERFPYIGDPRAISKAREEKKAKWAAGRAAEERASQ